MKTPNLVVVETTGPETMRLHLYKERKHDGIVEFDTSMEADLASVLGAIEGFRSETIEVEEQTEPTSA